MPSAAILHDVCAEHGHAECVWCETFPPPAEPYRMPASDMVLAIAAMPPRRISTREEIDARRARKREARNG